MLKFEDGPCGFCTLVPAAGLKDYPPTRGHWLPPRLRARCVAARRAVRGPPAASRSPLVTTHRSLQPPLHYERCPAFPDGAWPWWGRACQLQPHLRAGEWSHAALRDRWTSAIEATDPCAAAVRCKEQSACDPRPHRRAPWGMARSIVVHVGLGILYPLVPIWGVFPGTEQNNTGNLPNRRYYAFSFLLSSHPSSPVGIVSFI